MGKIAGVPHTRRVFRFTVPSAGLARADTIRRAIDATRAEMWRATSLTERERIQRRLDELERALELAQP